MVANFDGLNHIPDWLRYRTSAGVAKACQNRAEKWKLPVPLVDKSKPMNWSFAHGFALRHDSPS